MQGEDWLGRVECSPGLDDVLLEELESIGVSAKSAAEGVVFSASAANLARLHEDSRIAERVWVRLGRAPCASLDALAQGVRALAWRQVLDPRQGVDVVVRGHGGALRRGAVVVRKVEHTIRDAMQGPRLIYTGRPPPPLRIRVDLAGSHANVWIDASGDDLYRRGWRPEVSKAPLRESLAAAVLQSAGWTPGHTLVDPMCGSGTLALEAARIAAGLPVHTRPQGQWRHWPAYAKAKAPPPLVRHAIPTRIYASDRDPGAVAVALRNAQRAQVGRSVQIAQAHLADLQPPEPTGFLIANPPWGHRLASEDAMPKLLASWRSALAAWNGWHVAWLVPDARAASALGHGFHVALSFRHGGVPVVLAVRKPKGA